MNPQPATRSRAPKTRTQQPATRNQKSLLLLVLLAGCQFSEADKKALELPEGQLAGLRGTWLLVPEASHADTLTYRPNTYRFKFRPAGRSGFCIGPAGRFTRYDVAAGGGLLAHEGTWVSAGADRLLIHLPDLEPAEPDYELQLLSYHRRVLKLRRLATRPAVEVIRKP